MDTKSRRGVVIRKATKQCADGMNFTALLPGTWGLMTKSSKGPTLSQAIRTAIFHSGTSTGGTLSQFPRHRKEDVQMAIAIRS